MKVVVLGAGVIGVCTAYYLTRAGHTVTVIDRSPGPALETSFANAGMITPGYASPWAAPGVPLKAIKWMFERHAPFKFRFPIDIKAAGWMYQMWRNCSAERFAVNTERMIRVSEYSRQAMIDLREEISFDYDQRMRGTLQLFRRPEQLRNVEEHTDILDRMSIPYEVLDSDACVGLEPGLSHSKAPIAGGIRLPQDETGDCHKFTTALANLTAALGADFLFNHEIKSLVVEGNTIKAVRTSLVDIEADTYVVALGSYTPQLLRPVGIRTPVYPLKGYSLTLPITDEARAPKSTLLDDQYKVALTRLGDRIRVGGIAEIAGFNSDFPLARKETLDLSVQSLFPDVGDKARAQYWHGFRPMTPDGTPIIGGTSYKNMYINSGHGTFGWTMAAGAGKILAAKLDGATENFPEREFGLVRYEAGSRQATLAG